jgi:hypothetical protein
MLPYRRTRKIALAAHTGASGQSKTGNARFAQAQCPHWHAGIADNQDIRIARSPLTLSGCG